MFKSIRTKIFVYFIASSLIVLGIYGLITYNLIRANLETEMESRLLTAGKIINENINSADIRLFAIKGKIYASDRAKFTKYRDITGVRDILVINTDGKIVMSTLDEAEKFFLKLDTYEIGKALSGKEASSPLYSGAGGIYYKTGYVPVFDKGKVAGVIGVEASVEYVKYMNDYKNFLYLIGLISMGVALGIALLISSGITGSIRKLSEKARRIAKRDFDENIVVKGEEEIKVLADTLDNMKQELKTYITDREKMATVGEFSAGIAHEIRNSLGVLSGYGELIKEKSPDEKIKKYAQDIVKNSMKMSEFLNNFLTYTKEFTPDLQKTDMKKLTDEAVNECSEAVKKAVVKKYSAGEIIAVLDPYLIKKVLYNIIMNAYQAIENENKLIEVSLGKIADKTEITVTDNGKGIPAGQTEKVFQPFFTGRREGTGLGLAISYRIVKEVHKGELTVSSVEGKGSTFKIVL